MTIFPEKTAIPSAAPLLNKRTGRAWLNFLLVVLLAGTMLSLPAGAHGIHCAAGMLLLAACSLHLIRHGRWIKAVILNTPKNITPALHRQRWLFWAMLVSSLLCGLSGLVALLSVHVFLPLLCLVTPIHALSGLAFLGLNMFHLILQRNWFLTRLGAFFRVS